MARTGFILGASVLAAAAIGAPAAAGRGPSVAQLRTHGPDPAFPGMRRQARASVDEPFRWCGEQTSSDNAVDQVDNGTYRFHAVYMLASDSPSHFTYDLATRMQDDAFAASELIEKLYGRAFRFDMGTSCGPAFLDISVVRSKFSAAAFKRAARRDDGSLDIVAKALSAGGFRTLRDRESLRAAAALKHNYVVWLDAPGAANSCGVAQVLDDSRRTRTNWNNTGGKVALLFGEDGRFCGPAAVRHEIGHTLGAIQPGAPHAFDGMHCNDAYEDAMCYPSSPVRASASFESEFFDFGNDDYWDPPQGPPLRWWTVNLSRFVCADADCNRSTYSD